MILKAHHVQKMKLRIKNSNKICSDQFLLNVYCKESNDWLLKGQSAKQTNVQNQNCLIWTLAALFFGVLLCSDKDNL